MLSRVELHHMWNCLKSTTLSSGVFLTQVGVVVTPSHVQFEACQCCQWLTTGLLKQSACCALQVMQYADRALMEGLKGRCAMLLHPHVTQDSALLLLQQALAMDSDRCTSAHIMLHCLSNVQKSLVRQNGVLEGLPA